MIKNPRQINDIRTLTKELSKNGWLYNYSEKLLVSEFIFCNLTKSSLKIARRFVWAWELSFVKVLSFTESCEITQNLHPVWKCFVNIKRILTVKICLLYFCWLDKFVSSICIQTMFHYPIKIRIQKNNPPQLYDSVCLSCRYRTSSQGILV